MHRWHLNASRNMGLLATLSARALKVAGNCFTGFFHHEPLIARDALQDFSTVMGLLEWIGHVKAAWIRPHCRVPLVVREKP